MGVDVNAQQRLWQVRESVAEVLGVYGPPLKFDVSLPLSAIPAFASQAGELVAEHAPDAIPVLFGHIGEGNLHLNVLRCVLDAEREAALYSAMMALIARLGGNVSSEHGVGSRKRDYVGDVAHARPTSRRCGRSRQRSTRPAISTPPCSSASRQGANAARAPCEASSGSSRECLLLPARTRTAAASRLAHSRSRVRVAAAVGRSAV